MGKTKQDSSPAREPQKLAHPHFQRRINCATKPCAIISDDPASPEGSCTTREIDLATAISELKQAREETEDGKPPFFSVVGAGPLASAIAPRVQSDSTGPISVRNSGRNSPLWAKRDEAIHCPIEASGIQSRNHWIPTFADKAAEPGVVVGPDFTRAVGRWTNIIAHLFLSSPACQLN